MLCNITDIIMYIIVGGYSGLANGTASFLKNLAFVKYDSKRFTVLFSVLRIILLCFAFEGLITFCFICIEIAGTVAVLFGREDGFSLKVISFIGECILIVYDALFATLFVASMTAVSTVVSLVGVLLGNRCKEKK